MEVQTTNGQIALLQFTFFSWELFANIPKINMKSSSLKEQIFSRGIYQTMNSPTLFDLLVQLYLVNTGFLIRSYFLILVTGSIFFICFLLSFKNGICLSKD